MKRYIIQGNFSKEGKITIEAKSEEDAWNIFFGIDFGQGWGIPDNMGSYTIEEVD